MREIGKFRGRRVDNGEWAYGSLLDDFGKKTWIVNTIQDIKDAMSDNVWFEVDPSTVGEFTGIPDQNEVDLYEDDIVKVSWLAELGITELDCESVGVIEYAQARFRIRLVPPFKTGVYCGADCPGTYEEEFLELYKPESWDEGYCIERIGNIYDNPELARTALGGDES